MKARQLSVGSQFYVEPEDAPPIPVQITAPGSWGLVHGVMQLPCVLLDTNERVVVDIHMDAEVRLVEAGAS